MISVEAIAPTQNANFSYYVWWEEYMQSSILQNNPKKYTKIHWPS